MAKACLNLNMLDDDELYVAKFDLEELRKKKQIPASESVELLKKIGVEGGEINNISGQATIDLVKQFYEGYKVAENANFDSPSFRELAQEIKGIDRFRWRKLYAPVYYVLSKGGKKSQKLANNLLDYDVVYTKDKAFADDTIIQVKKVLGKDIDNMELLEPEMRTQQGRPLTADERKAIEAFDLVNPKTKKLWNMNDEGFDSLDDFTQRHIVARDYHKQMTDFYWNRVKQEVKAKSTKFQYEEWLKEYDEKYIKNYMTRAVSREVLQELAKNSADSKIIVDIANKRLKSRAKELANEKFKKQENPNKWQAEYEKNLNDTNLLNSIKEEAYNIMTYNPARVVNQHFKERGILLPYEIEVTTPITNRKKMVRTYVKDYASVMDRYSTVSSKFIATTKFFPEFTKFGTQYKLSSNTKADLQPALASGSPEAQYAAKHINELLGLGLDNQSNSVTNFLSTASTLSAAAGLSSPTSGVKNLLITIPRSLGTFGAINTMRSFIRLFGNYGQLMDEARREGFTTYQTKTLALQDKAVKLPFNLGEFSMEKLFDFNLMTRTEGIGRVAQVQAGLMTFELQLDKVHGVKNYLPTTPKNQIERFWKNTFKLSDDEVQFLLDKKNYRKIQDGLADIETTGKMDYIRAKISHYSHVSTSGGTGPQLLPAWMNNKYVKPMSLFYRMAYSTSFDMYQNTLKPIVEKGNIAPLARATVGSLMSGYALWAMYDTLFDTKNPLENEDKITQMTSYLFRSEFLQLGTDFVFNPYGASLFSKKDKFSVLNYNDQMMASSFNPLYGSAVMGNLISAGSLFAHTFLPALGFTEKRKTVGQALDDYMNETVVLYAQYRKNFQEPFGLSWKQDKLYKTAKEFGTYARRWKSENGYKDNPMAYGQTDRTPFYRSLRNAFYNGNQKDFNRAYWSAYNYIATTFMKDFRDNGKGLSPHQIHKQAQRALDAHLNQYSVARVSEGYDEKRGIIPDREFMKYLKDDKLRAKYKKAKDEFFYRKRKLVTSATGGDNFRKYSMFYNL